MNHRGQIRDYVLQEILDAKRREIALEDDESIVKSGLINSMAIVEIISYLENNFGVNITDGEIQIEDFDSIDSMCRLVERGGAVPGGA